MNAQRKDREGAREALTAVAYALMWMVCLAFVVLTYWDLTS